MPGGDGFWMPLPGGGGATPGSPTAYTPTLTNGTLGNGTLTGTYVDMGKLRLVRTKLTWGSTTTLTASTTTGFTLPAGTYAGGLVIGVGSIMGRDSSTGQWRSGTCWVSTSDLLAFMFDGAISPLSFSGPWTWATGDTIEATGIAILT